MEIDIETAAPGGPEASRRTFRRWLAVLVGSAAVMAATMATVESNAGRTEELAFVRASRLSIDLFARIAGSSPRTSFRLGALQQAVSDDLDATSRALVALERGNPDAAGLAESLRQAQERSSRRLVRAADEMAAIPREVQGIDPALRDVATTDIAGLGPEVVEQNRQVDRAERAGTVQERAMFAIALVAIAAVLLGLAGLMGDGRPGRVALYGAAAALVVSVGWVASGFLAA